MTVLDVKEANKLELLWLSLLAQPGDVLYRQGVGAAHPSGLVAYSCESGCCLVPCSVQNFDTDTAEVMVDLEGADVMEFEHIVDWKAWTALPAERRVQPNRKPVMEDGGLKCSVLLVSKQPPQTLPARAATKAFMPMTIPQMQQFMETAEVNWGAGKRPVSEKEVATCLIRWTLFLGQKI